jgi:hypothetical protein
MPANALVTLAARLDRPVAFQSLDDALQLGRINVLRRDDELERDSALVLTIELCFCSALLSSDTRMPLF